MTELEQVGLIGLGVILTFVFLYVILPKILKWWVDKRIDDESDDDIVLLLN